MGGRAQADESAEPGGVIAGRGGRRSRDACAGRDVQRSGSRGALFLMALLTVFAASCRPAGPPRTSPVKPLGEEPVVRVGIAVGVEQVEVSAAAPFELTIPSTGKTVSAGAREVWTFTAAGAGEVVGRGAGGKMIGPTSALVRIQVPGAKEPVLIGGKPYRGGALVRPGQGGRVTAINILELETYLLGVVPLEIGARPAAELEAVKAQAIAARTYAIRHLASRESLGFDFYATVADQVYGGTAAEDPTASRAVRETAGEIITHQGVPILAYYHSTCGGRTAAIEEVWPRAPVPYLKSISDEVPGAKGRYYCESSNRFRWDISWTGVELREILARTLAARAGRSQPEPIRRVQEIETEGRTPSGRVRRLVIGTDAGRYVATGDSIRRVLEPKRGQMLNSALFVLDAEMKNGEVSALRARGGGWGHGVGMCQVGALGRARAGQDYRKILTTYYQHTEISRVY